MRRARAAEEVVFALAHRERDAGACAQRSVAVEMTVVDRLLEPADADVARRERKLERLGYAHALVGVDHDAHMRSHGLANQAQAREIAARLARPP